MDGIYPQWTGNPNDEGDEGVLVEIGVQLQIDVDEFIPANTWVTASVITVYDVTTTIATIDGIAHPPTRSLKFNQRGVFFQVPVWLSEIG